MLHRLVWSLLALAFGAAPGLAQGEPKKDAARSNEVEVRMADGSAVRMIVLQESIDIATKYGKLTVPTTDIRQIELALRLSDETVKRIETAITQLGDPVHQRRQMASKDLLAIGAPALPALAGAARSLDLEVARRSKEVLQQLRDKLPPAQQRILTSDYIHTNEFSIAGKINSPTLKARTQYFGEVQLQVADLRSIRWLAAGGEFELTVDATKYGGVNNVWMETEIDLHALDGLLLTASGQVDLYPQQPGQYLSGPAGNRDVGGRRGPHAPGSLLARIGESGKVFIVGERYAGTPSEAGKLYLQIVPGPWQNGSTGSYSVKVVTGPAAAAGR